jgi:hypothetical protein
MHLRRFLRDIAAGAAAMTLPRAAEAAHVDQRHQLDPEKPKGRRYR